MRRSSFAAVLLAAVSVVALPGCATTQAAFDAMERSANEAHVRTLAAYPDQSLAFAFLGADGESNRTYACEGCIVYLKRPEHFTDFITISRKGARVTNGADLQRQVSLAPIETSDVGRIFIEHANRRGNSVAVYGAPVNHRMIELARPHQNRNSGALYLSNVSSAIIEIDRTGAYVSILAVSYELSRGLIVTDTPEAKHLFTRQDIFVLPQSTARYVQERMPASFTENYRVR